jgi:hypothetical protein
MRLNDENSKLYRTPYYFNDAIDLKHTGVINAAKQYELVAVGHIAPDGYQKEYSTGYQLIWIPEHMLDIRK